MEVFVCQTKKTFNLLYTKSVEVFLRDESSVYFNVTAKHL